MRKNSWAGKSLKVTVEEQAGGCVEGHMARHPHTYRVSHVNPAAHLRRDQKYPQALQTDRPLWNQVKMSSQL